MTDDERKGLLDFLRRSRKDIIFFVNKAFGVDPTDQQKDILRSVVIPGSRTAVRAGHGVGKTTTLSWLVLWQLICFDDVKVPCTAPTSHQLKTVLWSEISKWVDKAHPWIKEQIEITADKVVVKGCENRFAAARTARKEKPEALQGFHATNLLFVVDEAPGVEDVIFEPMEGALSTQGARVIMMGNPTRTTGYFHRAFHAAREFWSRHVLSGIDCPFVTDEYVKHAADVYGEDSDFYRIRVLGEFPSASVKQLISSDVVEACAERKLHVNQYNFAPKVLGVDVAWMGDDRSAVFLRQGLAATLLGSWLHIDNMQLAGMVAQFQDQHKTDGTFIDVGWGSGVIDRLRQMGHDPIAVNFGGRSTSDRYVNKRTEMWVEMKEWLEGGGAIPRHQDLRDDLVGPEYQFTKNGQIQLEAKDSMKKRGIASPDLADALGLTFAGKIYKNTKAVPVGVGASADVCEMEYDLFA